MLPFRGTTRGLWLDQARQDLHFAARTLRKNPGFTLVAALTLALGIGAATAIFSVVNTLLLKPLPYEQPGQLVQVFETPQPGNLNSVSPGAFLDWREQATLFEGFSAYGYATVNLTGAGEPIRINGLRMTANGLALLRAKPLRGRLFAPDEDQDGKDHVVVLTYELWKRQFGGAEDLVGRPIQLNGQPWTVIGVLPKGFLPFEQQDFVIPYVFRPEWRTMRGGHMLRVQARLKPGVTVEQGRAEIAAIGARTKSLHPAWKKNWGTAVNPLDEQLARDIKPALLVLLAAVGSVLLIACANVANLLLARAATRQKEIALRAALGAGRGRIIRQLLVESVTLSLLGGTLGLVLAAWCTGALRQLISSMNFARAHEIALDGKVLGLAIVVAFVTGIAFGLAPALQASRVELTGTLKEGGRGSTRHGDRVRSGLIVAEMALSLVLLVGAGLLLHSFARILATTAGLEPEHTLTLELSLPDARYPDNPARVAFFNRAAERIAQLPGVVAAGFGGATPFTGGSSDRFVRIPGWSGDRDPGYDAIYDWCTPDYFRALGVPLRAGRFFEARDTQPERRVAIINEKMAHDCFPNENPLGRQLVYDQDAWEIIGVVGDVRVRGLTRPPQPIVYRAFPADTWRSGTLFVRTRGAPMAMAETVRKAMHEIDPNQPVANVRSLADVAARSVGDRRLTAVLVALFATAALSLAAIGLYGVIAYAVNQRTREFGIRLALGATKNDVLALVLKRGVLLALLGLLCGFAASFGLTHLLARLLYEIKPTDPVTLVIVSVLLLLVALVASWLPARRAAQVDPIEALRCE